ncbi:MAG TPA: DUF1778 domain-containing protein [Thermomicrobiales bacterium]|nr:DUF1778 domain-containing protein [Thermomicrobiales bacterium]
MVIQSHRPKLSTERQTRTTKNRRIAFRLTDELGAQLDRAVALTGRSQTDLITEAIADKADEVIRAQRLLELTDRDMDALLAAIEHPPVPNAAMLRSIARWRERGAPA